MALLKLLSTRYPGWPRPILKALCACVLAGHPVLLLGRHGAGKTSLLKAVGTLLGERVVAYDGALIETHHLTGIPRLGGDSPRLEFYETADTVWQADLLLIDELNRGRGEIQNALLSIIEGRPFFGRQLSIRAVVASANPDYGATQLLDEALLDRFRIVVRTNYFDQPSAHLDDSMIAATFAYWQDEDFTRALERQRPQLQEFQQRFGTTSDKLRQDWRFVCHYTIWSKKLIAELFAPKPGTKEYQYVSPRTRVQHLARVGVALAAWDLASGTAPSMGMLLDNLELAARLVFQSRFEIDEGRFVRAVGKANQEVIQQKLPGLDSHDESEDPGLVALNSQGPLAVRLDGLARLEYAAASPPQQAAIGLAVRKLLIEVLEQAEKDPELLPRLHQAAIGLPSELLAEIENGILSSKIRFLALLGDPACAEVGRLELIKALRHQTLILGLAPAVQLGNGPAG